MQNVFFRSTRQLSLAVTEIIRDFFDDVTNLKLIKEFCRNGIRSEAGAEDVAGDSAGRVAVTPVVIPTGGGICQQSLKSLLEKG